MIRVGIIGADTKNAGELLRILLFHPEVEIVTLYAPSLSGRRLSALHHGFIGETEYFFTDKIDMSKLDVVFLADDSDMSHLILERASEWEHMKIIDLSPSRFISWPLESELAYGLSEINRKELVRGATMARIPSTVASIALVALYPLSSHLLLSSDVEIEASLPADLIEESDTERIQEEIKKRLEISQMSFSDNVKVILHPSASNRQAEVCINLKCPLGIDEIVRLYEGMYDDHNFTFIPDRSFNRSEVEGTQKCLVSFNKPGAGLLEIQASADARMRGGAGDAVHAMNLLFALHEKVGLALKPSLFTLEKNEESTDDKSLGKDNHGDWFA